MLVRPLRTPWNDTVCLQTLWILILAWAMLCGTWEDLVVLYQACCKFLAQLFLRMRLRYLKKVCWARRDLNVAYTV